MVAKCLNGNRILLNNNINMILPRACAVENPVQIINCINMKATPSEFILMNFVMNKEFSILHSASK